MADALDGYYSFDEDDLINDHIQEEEYYQPEEYPEEFYESTNEKNETVKENDFSLLDTQPLVENNKNDVVITNSPIIEDNDDEFLNTTTLLNTSITRDTNVIHINTNPKNNEHQRNLFQNLDRLTRKYEWRTTSSTDDIPQDLFTNTWKKKNKIEADAQLVRYLQNQWYGIMYKDKSKLSDRYKVQNNRMIEGDDIPVTLSNGDRIHIPKRTHQKITTDQNYFTKGSSYKPHTIMNKKVTRKNMIACSDLWVDKYSPHNFLHLLSYEKINRDVLRALRLWDPYVFKRSSSHEKRDRPETSKRVILLTGAPGIGKTTLAHIVSKHAGYNTVEINASLDRSTSLLTLLTRSMSSNTLTSSKPNTIILDEVDGLDSNTLKPLIKMFQNDTPKITRPIILIANNKYASVLRPIIPYVTSFHVNAPESNRLVSRCKHILSKENLSINQTQLLHQLVHSTNNDIRSCLFTLQFISSAARASSNKTIIDLSSYLTMDDTSMWKDDRMDTITILKSIFRKNKNETIKSLMDGGMNEITKLLDLLFINVPSIPFIDPNMDKLYTASDWLSTADLYRSSKSTIASNHPYDHMLLQKWYIPVFISAIHSLCRTNTTSQLQYSTKELGDLHYTKEAHCNLVHRFQDGLSVQQYVSTSVKSTLLDVIPYLLYFLQAGEGKFNVKRAVSAYEFYNEEEKIGFDVRMRVIKDFHLNFVFVDEDEHHNGSMKLEPEIDRLMRFRDLEYLGGSCEIPSMGKQLLAHTAHLERMKDHHTNSATDVTNTAKLNNAPQQSKEVNNDSNKESVERDQQIKEANDTTKKRLESNQKKSKKSKVEKSFLSIGAAKSKALLNKRKAASCIGYEKKKICTAKLSYSGSGVPLNQVIKFKYQKGFTQAVRIPCRLEDLI